MEYRIIAACIAIAIIPPPRHGHPVEHDLDKSASWTHHDAGRDTLSVLLKLKRLVLRRACVLCGCGCEYDFDLDPCLFSIEKTRRAATFSALKLMRNSINPIQSRGP